VPGRGSSRKAQLQVIPNILIVTTCQWFTTARLGIAFAKLGCNVEAICPLGHPLRKTKAVRRTHRYQALSPLDSLLRAIHSSNPDLIVPGDELASKHLQDLYLQEKKRDGAGRKVRELIEHSIGSPDSFSLANARASFMELAKQEGIRVPKTAVLADVNALETWASQMGFPLVLKADGSSSGEGVKIARTFSEAKRAFRALQAPPLLIRVAKRVLINRDMRLLRPALERRRSVVNAQEFVAGCDATSLVACWKGEVLAALHFEVVKKQRENGPASVLRLIEIEEIAAAVEKLVRRLNISGLHGFDFLLEKETGNPYLIEMNPRPTQVGHLALGPGRDLPAALSAAVCGKAVPETLKATENTTIALFPQEWLRNPESTFLTSAYHDIPWEEPDLMRDCLRKTRKWNNWRSLEHWIHIFSTHRSSAI
jgi:formate-dependent phosphoribosylglycinamide formyltransferase (GAR transformylase)